jgi:N,N'-diacetyllegionaminate synthase
VEPDELKRLVDEIRQLDIALSSRVDKNRKARELREMKIIFEKSIVTAGALKKGTTLTRKHLAFKKPGTGIPARDYKTLLNKKINKSLPRDHMFTAADFE